MERRFSSSAAPNLEERGTDYPFIVGLGAAFYRADDPGTEYELWDEDDYRCVERLMPTAFDQMLNSKADVCALFNHDPNNLLGRTASGTLKLERTATGLKYTIDPPDTPLARSVVASIRRGDLRGSSFSFLCDQNGQRFIRQGNLMVREIHSVSYLGDVGPVTRPAYAATTTGMRDERAVTEARQAYAAWIRSGLGTELEIATRRVRGVLVSNRA